MVYILSDGQVLSVCADCPWCCVWACLAVVKRTYVVLSRHHECWLSQRCVQMPIEGTRSADGTHTGDMHNGDSQRPLMQAHHKCILISIMVCLPLAGIVYVGAV